MTNLQQLPEDWKPIVGYECLYEVSNHGRIRGLERASPRNRKLKAKELKVWSAPGRYPRISLFKDGEDKSHCVHRLEAIAFLPNPENKRAVNHKDGDKNNNYLPNLEWVTFSENQIHAIEFGLSVVPILPSGEKHPTAKLNNVDVAMIRVLLKHDFTLMQIAKRFNVHEVHIGAIKLGKTWKHQN